MKAIRLTEFSLPGYGRISFCAVKDAPGYSHRVLFTRAGQHVAAHAGWLKDDAKPNSANAIFFTRVFCAKEDGLPRYHYADKKINPPRRDQAVTA